ncbi:rhodopsin, GQ-coupled-like [Amphiura filiformis]|uniref:rhodopsin, GQ-coupled-like n=1 Tax=Amphiura filiformis TaxID=82378 RepID=UPI003B21172D
MYSESLTRSLRTPPNMLIINLACSDLLMVFFEFPMMFLSTVHGRWLFGEVGCDAYAWGGAMFGVLSIATLTAIAFDRQYAICSSLDKLRNITYGRAGRMVVCVWLYSVFWSIFPFFGIGDYVLEGYGVSCTFHYLDTSRRNRIYVGFLFIGDFFLPLCAIISCYVHIVGTVRANRKNLADISKDESIKKDKKGKKKSKRQNSEYAIAKIGMTLTALFALSWTPYATVAFIGEYINGDLLGPMVQTLPVVLAKSSAIWNPIVYAISHKKFKAAIRDHFIKKCCGELPETNFQSQGTSRDSLSSADTLRQSSKKSSHHKHAPEVAVISTNQQQQTTGILKEGNNRRSLQVRLSTDLPEEDPAIGTSSTQLWVSGTKEVQGISNPAMEMQNVDREGLPINPSDQLTRM